MESQTDWREMHPETDWGEMEPETGCISMLAFLPIAFFPTIMFARGHSNASESGTRLAKRFLHSNVSVLPMRGWSAEHRKFQTIIFTLDPSNVRGSSRQQPLAFLKNLALLDFFSETRAAKRYQDGVWVFFFHKQSLYATSITYVLSI